MRSVLKALMIIGLMIAGNVWAGEFVELSRAQHVTGALYLRGHLIAQPYIFETDPSLHELYVRVDQDPSFASIGVFRLPLSIPDARYDRQTIRQETLNMLPDDSQTFKARSEVDSLALTTYYVVLRQTSSKHQAAVAATKVYRAYPDVVDSANVTDTGYVRYWKRCPFPFFVTFSSVGHLAPDVAAETRREAEALASALNQGQVVCYGVGGFRQFFARPSKQFADDLKALRSGKPVLQELPNFMRRDFTQPKSAQSIAKMASGGK